MSPNNADDEDLPKLPLRGRDRELWVGIFVILGIGATLTALFTLTDAATFRGRYIVTTEVSDAGGVRRGDPVLLRGVNIGRVQRFRIHGGGVAIRLEIEGEYQIPADSHVEIKSSGLLGGMMVDVMPGKSDQNLRNSDTLPGTTGGGTFDAAAGMADQAKATMTRVQTLLSDRTIKGIEDSSVEMRQLLKDLTALTAQERKELTQLNTSLRHAVDGVDRAANKPELDRAITRLDSLTKQMDEVSATLNRTSRSMETVLGRIERGEGSLGRLTKDESLYVNLDKAATSIKQAAEEMRSLTADIRRQPKKYLKLSFF